MNLLSRSDRMILYVRTLFGHGRLFGNLDTVLVGNLLAVFAP